VHVFGYKVKADLIKKIEILTIAREKIEQAEDSFIMREFLATLTDF